jgi:mono/diheme cytochrome c family protein
MRRRGISSAGLRVVFLSFALSCSRAPSPEGSLTFKGASGAARSLTIASLARDDAVRVVETHDPYYGKAKRFRALPVAHVLGLAYDAPLEALRPRSFVLQARDGYAVPIEGERLLDGHAFIAIDDVDVPGFAPIGPQQVSPAPAYLIWDGTTHTDLETHPRPWQLSAIAIVDPATLYPHTVPEGEPAASAAMRGYQLFRERCIRCHAINREGGRVGPDLNVPQSIVAYRPEDQIRAYIRDPLTFRYGAMPPNPDLKEPDLDALIAYFRAMSTRPHDLEARRSP